MEILRSPGEALGVKDIATPHSVFVALGSNLGDSISILVETMKRLEALSAGPIRRSSLWSTSPVDCPPGSPPFVNAVVALTPMAGETPESLLIELQEMEHEFGRVPKKVLNDGHGEMRVTLGKESVTLALKPGQKAQGANLDRFGLFTSTAGGQMVKIYLDDLKYTAGNTR